MVLYLQEPARLDNRRVGVVSQTTLDKDTFMNVVRELIGGVEELRIYNAICESTEVRQRRSGCAF
jgi:4-hydroxy-3-methylbut-2-enyl diphosphate reductase IspH